MSINGSSYQANALNINGSTAIDSSLISTNTSVSNIVNNTINLLSNFTIPSALVSSFVGTQLINTSVSLPSAPYAYTFYEWSEPILGGAPCLVVCSENPSDLVNVLSCTNSTSLNSGAGFSGFQTTGTVGMYPGTTSTGYNAQHTFLNPGGSGYNLGSYSSTPFPIYSTFSLNGLNFDMIFPYPTCFTTFTIRVDPSKIPNVPTMCFFFGCNYSGLDVGLNNLPLYSQYVQIDVPYALTYDISGNCTVTFNNTTNYSFYRVSFVYVGGTNGTCFVSSIQWGNGNTSQPVFTSTSLIKQASTALITQAANIGNYSLSTVTVGNPISPINFQLTLPQFNGGYYPMGTYVLFKDSETVTNAYTLTVPATMNFQMSNSGLPSYAGGKGMLGLFLSTVDASNYVGVDLLKNGTSIFGSNYPQSIVSWTGGATTNGVGALTTSPTYFKLGDAIKFVVYYSGSTAKGLKVVLYWC